MTASTIVKLIRYKIIAEKSLANQIRELEKLQGIPKDSIRDKKFDMTSFSLESSEHNEKCYLAIFSGILD
jgi:hypothetical protein